MFHGYDFDTTMLRIAAMNLIMHGVESPDIHYQDTMSQSFSANFPQASKNAFNLILANPPFTGSLDEEDIDSTLSAMVKTKNRTAVPGAYSANAESGRAQCHYRAAGRAVWLQ